MTLPPNWFEVVFTHYDLPTEIPCPKKVPTAAVPLGQFFWGHMPGQEAVFRYSASANRGHRHVILWAGGIEETSERWLFAPVAYASQRGPDGERITKRQGGLWLLEAFWREEHSQDGVPGQDGMALISPAEFNEICCRVWPR